jgi:hypothetical protein
MTVFVTGFIFGAAVFWNVSLAVERFRRARADLRATRRGLRTLVEMMANRAWEATQGVLTAAGIVAVLVLLWRWRGWQ